MKENKLLYITSNIMIIIGVIGLIFVLSLHLNINPYESLKQFDDIFTLRMINIYSILFIITGLSGRLVKKRFKICLVFSSLLIITFVSAILLYIYTSTFLIFIMYLFFGYQITSDIWSNSTFPIITLFILHIVGIIINIVFIFGVVKQIKK